MQKLNKLAKEVFGEFGFATLNEEQQEYILKLKKSAQNMKEYPKYTVKITFTDGDVEHYMSNSTDIKLILPEFDIENVHFVEISPNK